MNKPAQKIRLKNKIDTLRSDSITLWQVLTADLKKGVTYAPNKFENSDVEITFTNKNMVAKLFLADSLIAIKKLKGNIKNTFFTSKKRIKYFGFPFLYVRYQTYQLAFAIDDKNNLLVHSASDQFGWILLLHAGYLDQKDFSYPIVTER